MEVHVELLMIDGELGKWRKGKVKVRLNKVWVNMAYCSTKEEYAVFYI